MLDEPHVDVAGEESKLDRAKFSESPAFAAAARGDGFAPNRRHLLAQRPVLDLPDAGKELGDFSDAVDGRFLCFHGGEIDPIFCLTTNGHEFIKQFAPTLTWRA